MATKNTETTEVVGAKKERAPRVPRLERLKAEILKAEQLEKDRKLKTVAAAKAKLENALVALAKAQDKADQAEAELKAAQQAVPFIVEFAASQGEGS